MSVASMSSTTAPSFSPIRRVSVRNSISLRNPIRAAASGPSRSGRNRKAAPVSGASRLQGAPARRLMRICSAWSIKRLAPFRLFDLLGAGEQRVEIAELVDQLSSGLDRRSPARRARCRRCLRLRLEHRRLSPVGTPNFSMTSSARRSAGLSWGRSMLDPIGFTSCMRSLSEETIVTSAPQLVAACSRVSRDQIVGFEVFELDARETEGARRIADQSELRYEVFRRVRSLSLVFGRRSRCGSSSSLCRKSPRDGWGDRRRSCLESIFQSMLQKPETAPTGRAIGFPGQRGQTRDRRGK